MRLKQTYTIFHRGLPMVSRTFFSEDHETEIECKEDLRKQIEAWDTLFSDTLDNAFEP